MSNFGALIGHRKPATKKELREAVAACPDQVTFYDTTAPVFGTSRGTVGVGDLKPSDCIVGPDPYTKRSWYANVKNGKVV